MTTRLLLHEELMLLALKDREGTISATATYAFGIGGAVLAELLMSGLIGVEQVRKKTLVRSLDRTPTGDELVDEWVEKIATDPKPRVVRHCVARIANSKDLKHRVALRLCRRGILRVDEDKVLWLFSRKIYPELDPGPERELIGRLERAIFEDGPVDPRTAILVALANNADVLKPIFGKSELEARKDRIAEVSDGAVTAEATKEAIQAMQTAVMVAVMVPTIVSS